MRKWDKKLIIEKSYPLAISAVVTLIIVGASSGAVLKDDMATAVNAVLVVVSIFLGFIGVLIGLIFAQSDNDILSEVFDSEHLLGLLKKYFMSVYKTGFLLLILSICIFFRNTIDEIIKNKFGTILVKFEMLKIEKIMIYLWILFLIWFFLSTYRLVRIVVELIFQKSTKKNEDKEETKDYTDLQNRHKNDKLNNN